MYIHLSNHSSVDGHLGCFYFLPIVNDAATNMAIQISLLDPASNSFVYIPEAVLLGHMVVL